MVDRLAVTASLYLFVISNVVSNVIFIFVVIRGRLAKQRGFLLLLNFAIVDVLSGINLIVDALAEFGPSIQLTPTQFSVVLAMELSILPSVVQVNLVLVNVSYVVETRKERVNGSRLVAALMVASPWLYAFLVPAPFVLTARLIDDPALVVVTFLFIGYVLPGIFAVVTAALAVLTFVTGKDVCSQEGVGGLDCSHDHLPVSTSTAEDSALCSEQHPRAETSSSDVRAAVRFPKAEVIVTAIHVTYVVVFVSTYAVAVLRGEDSEEDVIACLNCLWPTFLPPMCALRVDFRRATMLCRFGKVVRTIKLESQSLLNISKEEKEEEEERQREEEQEEEDDGEDEGKD